ncbi:phosphoribosyltransferase [Arthrobacter sp. TMS2-4]
MQRRQSAPFRDRTDAGRRLGQRLPALRGQDVVVLGLPRGGVPVAFEVATALGAPLDVILVRKLGVPFQPEFAMGAIGEGGARVLDPHVLSRARVTEEDLRTVEAKERQLLEERRTRYRQGRTWAAVRGRTVVVVDDGIATGSTARVACQVARQLGAARVILAVPVAPARTVASFEEADEVVSLVSPRRFQAVGAYYQDFSATEDDEVVRLLDLSTANPSSTPHPPASEPA